MPCMPWVAPEAHLTHRAVSVAGACASRPQDPQETSVRAAHEAQVAFLVLYGLTAGRGPLRARVNEVVTGMTTAGYPLRGAHGGGLARLRAATAGVAGQ